MFNENKDLDVLYQKLYSVANHFLEQTSMFTINDLNGHNPKTYVLVAQHCQMISANIEALTRMDVWDDERKALNARQAALVIERLALAIKMQHQEDLDRAVDELYAHTFI